LKVYQIVLESFFSAFMVDFQGDRKGKPIILSRIPLHLQLNLSPFWKSSSPYHQSNLDRQIREASERGRTAAWFLNRKVLFWISEFEGEEGELFGNVFGILGALGLFDVRSSAAC
jgi:hypothetical protein